MKASRTKITDLRYPDGSKPTYAAIRQYILHRDPTCQICLATPSTEVDHIWPRYFGGDDTAANLQGVCSFCNKQKGVSCNPDEASIYNLALAIDEIACRTKSAIDELNRFVGALTYRRDLCHDEVGPAEAQMLAVGIDRHETARDRMTQALTYLRDVAEAELERHGEEWG